MKDEGLMIMSMRVKDTRDRVEGSVEANCDKCGEKVWLSPASLELIQAEGKPSRVYCVQCALSLYPGMRPKITPGHLRELLQHMKKAAEK